MQSIIRVLRYIHFIVVYASKISYNNFLSWKQKSSYLIPIYLGNCLFCANLPAVITEQFMFTCQVSSILFCVSQVLILICYNTKSLISRSKKNCTLPATMCLPGLCLTQLNSIHASLSQKVHVDLHSLLDLICPSMITN